MLGFIFINSTSGRMFHIPPLVQNPLFSKLIIQKENLSFLRGDCSSFTLIAGMR